ncbi:MAG: efflux RND transporter periplasmic adaptor subunit [Methylococcales bacterium]|nr:efflux RND transporter periplasmic adaptor subunit [Methylococcales bacterium]
MNNNFNRIVVLASLLIGLSGCEQEQVIPEQIRAIKTITISRPTDTNTRKFSGVVMATEFSRLSFEVAGNVQLVNVDIGEKVSQDQQVATLNPKDFKLDLKAANADLGKARADVKHKRIEYKRELSIYEQGAGSQRQVDRAKYQFRAAQAAVKLALAKVKLAEHDLTKTVLTAPYNGYIAQRMVEPYMEVQVGQEVFRIDAQGPMEVQLGVPETVVGFLSVGAAATIKFPSALEHTFAGTISYLGSAAGDDNLFPVKVVMLTQPKMVAPGMTAEVTLAINNKGQKKGYLIPPIAITPIVGVAQQGYVYVYQPETSTVKKVLVKISGGQNNMGNVYEGLKPGDVIAVAGVSFLVDGMKVKLMQAKTNPEQG